MVLSLLSSFPSIFSTSSNDVDYVVSKTKCTRHYYSSSQKIFEKSLDVYEPVYHHHHRHHHTGDVVKRNPDDHRNQDDCRHQQHHRHLYNHHHGHEQSKHNRLNGMVAANKPIVILVVGSGWMGHYPFVYWVTSWWNSSGPINVTKSLGCTCICIRHRGAFPTIPMPYIVAFTVIGCLFAAMEWFHHSEEDFLLASWTFVRTLVSALVGTILLMGVGRGSAQFDDMLHDVADALVYLQDNQMIPSPRKDKNEMTMMTCTSSSSSSIQKTRPIIFGGYSSGGHAAASLLQRPHIFQSKGLPEPGQLFDAVLLISGVLAVRPPSPPPPSSSTKSSTHAGTAFVGTQRFTMTTLSLSSLSSYMSRRDNSLVRSFSKDSDTCSTTSSSSSGSSIHSHGEYNDRGSISIGSTDNDKIRTLETMKEVTSTLNSKPRWLTDLVMNLVWGESVNDVPCPLRDALVSSSSSTTTLPPRIPHLLIGCRNEMFGLDWLDVFFSSRTFHATLQTLGIPSKCVEIPSDHWNILHSRALSYALQNEIHWVLSTTPHPRPTTTKQQQQSLLQEESH